MADNDKDGRLTADEFIVAMHCCDIARTGQPLPISLPDGWLPTNAVQDERKNSLPKSNETPSYAELNQQLKETIQASNNSSATEPNEPDRKPTVATYEEKRLKNYEVCSENCHLTNEKKNVFTRREIANWNDVDNYYATKKKANAENAKNEVRTSVDLVQSAQAFFLVVYDVRIFFRT